MRRRRSRSVAGGTVGQERGERIDVVGAAQLVAHGAVAEQARDARQRLQVIGAGALGRQEHEDQIDRTLVHQVALPWHWGFGGPDGGDATNDLVMLSGDPNVSIHESKAFVCDVRAGRGSTGTSKLSGVHAPVRGAPNRDHPAETHDHE